LDIVTANFNSNNVSILLGTGTGTLFDPATTFSVAPGSAPSSVAVGDFNGDNILDIVTANFGSGTTVSILLGNGNGTFDPAKTFSVAPGIGPRSVAVGDFNGDNILDIVTANFNSNNVSILLGTGTGIFGSATTFTVGSGPSSVAVGDFN
jgi:hypothetical protein